MSRLHPYNNDHDSTVVGVAAAGEDGARPWSSETLTRRGGGGVGGGGDGGDGDSSWGSSPPPPPVGGGFNKSNKDSGGFLDPQEGSDALEEKFPWWGAALRVTR